MKISVITIAFNSQKTISKSIKSVLNQTFEDFEYIIVNHGSTDTTKDIILSYAKKDNRIKFIDIQENTGFIGKAINYALPYTSTNYVTFLDSDDMYYTDYLKIQYKNITSNNYDISITGSSRIDEYNKVFLYDTIPQDIIINNQQDYFNLPSYINTFPTRYFTVWWNKLYKINFLKDNNLFFPEDTLIHGDAILNLELLLKKPKIYCSSYIGVEWFQRTGSVSFGTYKPEYTKEIMDVCSKYFNIFDSYNANRTENEILAKKLLETVATFKRLKHYTDDKNTLLAEISNWKNYEIFDKMLNLSNISLDRLTHTENIII